MRLWLNRTVDMLLGKRGIWQAIRVVYVVAGVALAVMMFLTGADVTLRYVFDRPINGAWDITAYMMSIVVAGGLAYHAATKGHVRVELVVERLPQRAQAVISSIIDLLSLGLFSLITWRTFLYMKYVYDLQLTSAALPILKAFPFVGLVGFGCALLSLVLLANFLHSLSKVVGK